MNDAPPPASSTKARTWEMLCHLSALAGYVIPLGNIVGPLLIWQLKQKEFPSVADHGRESLNFQISVLLYALISGALTFLLVGFVLLLVLGVANVVLVVVASIKANNGESFRYPLSIRFLR